MTSRREILDTDVPFFPFRLRTVPDEPGAYEIEGHRLGSPFSLNRSAADVLRLADGTGTVGGIADRLGARHPGQRGNEIRRGVVRTLSELGSHDLVWWRGAPLRREPVGPPPSMFCEITAACNLRCLHCVVLAGERAPGELSTDRWLSLLQEMAEFGVTDAAFSGGEPLVHPDFRLLVERTRALGMSAQLATNGTLVDREMAAFLRDLEVGVQVSLDGSRREIHDRMRPGAEAFERTTAGIRALVAAGHRVTIGTVLSTNNRTDVFEVLRLARELGASAFRLIPFVPRGRGTHADDLEVPPEEVRRICAELRDRRGRCGIDIAPIEFEEMLCEDAPREPEDPNRGLGCHGAIGYGTITPTGELLPCHYFEGVRADSVAAAPFADVWRRSRFLTFFRQMGVRDLRGACTECDWLGTCGGGCRAVNFAKGDLFGANAQCWVHRDPARRAVR
jgi:radical SAM protein with 4Fe4S-binding SPASM domain